MADLRVTAHKGRTVFMNPPPGWHPDPYDPTLQRWWDGQQWTAQTQPAGAADPTLAFAPIGGPTDPGTPADGESPRKRKKWPWIAGAAVVGVVGISVLNQDPSKPEAESTVVSSTTVAATTTTATRTTTQVPRTTTTTAPAVVPLVPQYEDTTTASETVQVPTTTAARIPLTTEPVYVPPTTTKPAPVYTPPPDVESPSGVTYKNCDAVRAANADPIRVGDPGYARHLDKDGDGVGCE